MKIFKADRNYFECFAKEAREHGRSLQDHYLMIQKSLRNDSGGVEYIAPHETRGITFARRHIDSHESCLIMGGGAGGEAAWLIKHGIENIICLDISEKLLNICKNQLGIETVCTDMRSTGLSDQSYDVVLTHRSLHHMFYPFETLEEFARLARKKVIIINEPVKSRIKKLVRYLRKGRIISEANIYEYNFDPDDVHRYMAFNGFKLEGSIRYWELQRRKADNDLLNLVAYYLGNRFTAIYHRMT